MKVSCAHKRFVVHLNNSKLLTIKMDHKPFVPLLNATHFHRHISYPVYSVSNDNLTDLIIFGSQNIHN